MGGRERAKQGGDVHTAMSRGTCDRLQTTPSPTNKTRRHLQTRRPGAVTASMSDARNPVSIVDMMVREAIDLLLENSDELAAPERQLVETQRGMDNMHRVYEEKRHAFFRERLEKHPEIPDELRVTEQGLRDWDKLLHNMQVLKEKLQEDVSQRVACIRGAMRGALRSAVPGMHSHGHADLCEDRSGMLGVRRGAEDEIEGLVHRAIAKACGVQQAEMYRSGCPVYYEQLSDHARNICSKRRPVHLLAKDFEMMKAMTGHTDLQGFRT